MNPIPVRPLLVFTLVAAGTSACSDWGFSPFPRDPCRRDPAACLPDEPDRTCAGAPASAGPVPALVCPRDVPGYRGRLFWEQPSGGNVRINVIVPPDRSSSADGSLIPYDGAPPAEAPDRWGMRRGVDGAWVPKLSSDPLVNSLPPHVEADGSIWVIETLEDYSIRMRSFDGRTHPIPRPADDLSIYPNGHPMGDFDGDGWLDRGALEWVANRRNEIIASVREAPSDSDARRPQVGGQAATADVDGDGRRELMNYNGIVRRDSHYLCRTDTPRFFFTADVERDGKVEIVTMEASSTTPRRLSILGPDCQAKKSVFLDEAYPPGVMKLTSNLRIVAPVLQPDRLAFVVSVRTEPPLAEVYRGQAFAVFDHDLNFVRFAQFSLTNVVVDLDGDGVYELITTPPWIDRSQPEPEGLAALDFRTGEYHVIAEKGRIDSTRGAAFADIDGDGRGEIVASMVDADGKRWLRAYKGEGPGYAAAMPFWPTPTLPHLYNPDGTPSKEPVRWDRVGLYNAMPTGGWWAGVDADLRVRFTDVCDADCPQGWLTYTVQVGNHGHGDVGADVLVRVYGERGAERTLLSEQRYRDVDAGQWNAAESVSVRFQGEPFDRLRAVVEPDGWDSQECDKTNNEAVWNLDCR
jgi:hypothetical protein